MPIQIVDCFQIIHVADHHRKRFLLSDLNLRINLFFPLHIGMFVFYAGQGINRCHASGS